MPKIAPRQIADEKLRQLVEEAFNRLKDGIYEILPESCPLKSGDGLAPSMLGLINAFFLKEHFYIRDDVCLQCGIELCPWHDKVSHRWLRVLKVKVLGFLARFFKNPLTEFLNKIR
jgi:hypothetical protein